MSNWGRFCLGYFEGIWGRTHFSLFSIWLEQKNIEYKKMKQFCVSKFEIRNSKEKHEGCSWTIK